MTKVHYFQRYSTKENVITNNTLLLFSRLYQKNPNLLEDVLNVIGEENFSLSVGVSITQQKRGSSGQSIPDGIITQDSFKIVIETKVDAKINAKQLTNHLEKFENEALSVLLVITKNKLREKTKQNIVEKLERGIQNPEIKSKPQMLLCTFEDIISSVKPNIDEHDYELSEVIEDYEQFCIHEELLPRTRLQMRAVPCGKTLEENFEFNIYHQPADRSFRPYPYLGIYNDKAIRGIGKVVKQAEASNEEGELVIHWSDKNLTDDEREKIWKDIKSGEEKRGWSASKKHLFILVDNFYKTEYKKTSKYPMQGQRYFDLGDILNTEELPSTEKIAKELRCKEW